jgi:peroxiredoxin
MRKQTYSYVVQWMRPINWVGRVQQRSFTAISEDAAVALARWCAAPGCTDFKVLPRFTLMSQ